MSQSYSTSSRQHQATWPIFVQSPAQNNARFQATMTTYHARRSTSISKASDLVVSQPKGEAPRSSMTAHPVYQFWTPPQRSASPDEIAWTQPLETEGDSTSTPSASSDEDDDESPAETSLALVPKQLASQTPTLKKATDSDLFGHSPAISNLSKILSPMANQQGGMHLVAVRSPSVRYDKVIHGAFSPATTVHLALPHTSGTRAVSKPPLPLPGSAKAMPRPQGVTAQPRPNTTEALKSPPVIGLDLALQPPADHRDSAMTPRSSMAVRTNRPSLVVPVDIPKRMSTTASNASSQTIRKPSSAPTPSPISAGPPEASTMTASAFLNPTSAKVHNDTLHQPVHAPSSTSSSSTAVSITPSITITTSEPTAAASPARVTEPTSEAILNERAVIRSRTLSSTNLREASKSEAPAQTHSRGPSPHASLHSINLAEKELPGIPESSSPIAPVHRPGPTPIQPTIAVTDDETDVEVDEPSAPLRVVNVTSDFGMDSMASVPIAQAVPMAAPVNEGVTPSRANSIATAAVTSTPLPSRTRLESIARTTENVQHEPSLTNMHTTSEPSNIHTTVSNKHASLPPLTSGYAHPLSLRSSMPPNARSSLSGPAINAAQPARRSVQRPKLPPPSNRTWVPKNLTVPAPLSQSPSPITLTFPGTSSQPFPSQQPPLRQPQPVQNIHAPVPYHHHPQAQVQPYLQEQQQPQPQRQQQQHQPQPQYAMPRYSHVHSFSHPPPATPMKSQRILAQPEPLTPQHDYYSSDDDDPSKWASQPEPSASRRSSRSSRSSRSFNRNSIYGPHAESEEEDGGLLYPPPSISLPNLRPILQYPGDIEPITPGDGPGKKIKFAVPSDGNDKPSQAAGGRRRIRRRSNSTSSIARDPKKLPWSDFPDGSARRSGLITVADPFGYDYADEGRYDAINRPDLLPADIRERYVRPDGGPRLPEYRETFSSKTNALREAAEQESRARILGRKTRTPAVSVELEEDAPITTPVCLRRLRVTSEDGHGGSSSGGARLRRRSRSRDRTADWAPPPTIPDPERPAFAQYSMPPSSSSLSLLPNAFEKMSRKFSKLRNNRNDN